jgi:D-methionine transport system ATP-binding protein
MTEAIITLDHVVKEFRQHNGDKSHNGIARAVDDVSLTINQGDIFGIIGYSGAGKSTLVRLINALERPTSGTIHVLGTDITALNESKLRPIRQKIGMIFQQFNLFSTKTVAQNIAYPLQLDHWRKDYQDKRVNELLKFVGLEQYADRYPSQLSGGQKQRVGIARALATNPKILLADEATSALDPETTSEVLSLLKRVNEEFGITIVLITHQMSVVQAIANRVAVMSKVRLSKRAMSMMCSPLRNSR